MCLQQWATHTYVFVYIIQIFQGNTDDSTVVETQLPTPIVALCLRLYIMGWVEWPDLKMEVYGCPAA